MFAWFSRQIECSASFLNIWTVRYRSFASTVVHSRSVRIALSQPVWKVKVQKHQVAVSVKREWNQYDSCRAHQKELCAEQFQASADFRFVRGTHFIQAWSFLKCTLIGFVLRKINERQTFLTFQLWQINDVQFETKHFISSLCWMCPFIKCSRGAIVSSQCARDLNSAIYNWQNGSRLEIFVWWIFVISSASWFCRGEPTSLPVERIRHQDILYQWAHPFLIFIVFVRLSVRVWSAWVDNRSSAWQMFRQTNCDFAINFRYVHLTDVTVICWFQMTNTTKHVWVFVCVCVCAYGVVYSRINLRSSLASCKWK